MRDFVNPWRLFAYNDDGGTVICTYPEGVKKPKNPIPYSKKSKPLVYFCASSRPLAAMRGDTRFEHGVEE